MDAAISERTRMAQANFRNAKERLQKRVFLPISGVDFCFLTAGGTVESMAANLESVVDSLIAMRNLARKDASPTGKAKEIMKSWFRATYPFIHLFLTAGKTGSSITGSPYEIICNGLLCLLKVAYDESGRSEEINQVLNVLLIAVHRIQLTSDFPDQSSAQLDNVHAAALDLCSSVMTYLEIALKTFQREFFANVLTSLSRGNTQFKEARVNLDNCIERYTSAVVDLGCSLGIQLISQAKNIQMSVDELSSQLGQLMLEFESHSKFVQENMSHTLPTEATPESPTPARSSFLIPYERNPLFTGRDSFLLMLRDNLQNVSPKKYNRIAIHGLGGIGKTQIALEYCFRYQDNYDHIFWVSAAERTTLLSGFASIVKQTNCIAITDNSLLEEIAAEMIKWLDQHDNWLLVLDNLDDVQAVQNLLPRRGHTLITTRLKDVKQIPAEGLEVDLMEESEAIELLLQASENSTEHEAVQEARTIVQEVERLPLAIDQAAAFIRNSNLYTFLDVFRSSTAKFLSERPKGNHPYPNSISTTWSVSFDRLSQGARELVDILAFLNPDEILLEFIQAGRSGLSESMMRLVDDKYSLTKTLGELQSLSLIKIWDRGTRLSIHRLLQCVVRENLQEDRLDKQKQVLSICSSAFDYSPSSDSRTLYQKFLPQITACLIHLDPEVYDLFALSPLSDSLAAFLFDETQILECQNLNKKLLDIRNRTLGPDNLKTLSVKRGLAATYSGDNDLRIREIGIKLFEETLETQTRVYGLMHPETLWTRHGLARTYDYSGHVEKAAEMLQDTYDLRCQVLGPKNLHTLRTKFFLAGSYHRRGYSKQALKMTEETLVDQYRTLGESHPDTLRTMQCLARLYAVLGYVSKARTLYQETLLLKGRYLGVNHRLTLGVKEELEIFEDSHFSQCAVG